MQNRSRHFRSKAMVLPLLRECDGGDLGEREREKTLQILLSLLRRDLVLDNLSSTVLIHPHVAYPSMSFLTSSIINKCVLIHPGIMHRPS